MRSNIQTILNKKHFFKIINASDNNVIKFTLLTPSQLLIKNIYINWLQYLHSKTQKHMPVFIENSQKIKTATPPFGIIKHFVPDYSNTILIHKLNEKSPENKTVLNLKIRIPREDCMQYFVQWQRYRKYWWSSITTTPSLFAVNEIKQGDSETEVDIIAKLPCGTQPVEHIEVKNDDITKGSSCLTCEMSLESALFILLLDGSTNTNDEYLRLHRIIAPYTFSFALDFEDSKEKLKELATVMYYRLKLENISVWLPDFASSLEDQIKENFHMGVTYTAILNETTLENGIFHLMNSSTTLKEQVHVADFHNYAALICKAKN